MAKANAQVIADLKGLQMTVNEVDYSRCGYHIEVVMNDSQVRDFAKTLLDHKFYLGFVTAVHVKPAIEVIYQFANFNYPCRIKGRVSAGESGSVPTISDIFQGADWHERETRDFFGVDFVGHPNLKPLILAEEDADLKPLLKEDKKLKSLEAVSWQEEGSEPVKTKTNTKKTEE